MELFCSSYSNQLQFPLNIPHVWMHDPDIVRLNDTTWIVYTTGDHECLLAFFSNDRVNWVQSEKQVFPAGVGPEWIKDYVPGGTACWAPDITYVNNQYYLYYAVSTYGSIHSAIGLLTSSSGLPGTWRDEGPVSIFWINCNLFIKL